MKRGERVLHGGKIGERAGNIDKNWKQIKARGMDREEDRGDANNPKGEREKLVSVRAQRNANA